jgi:endo-1,4-beta-xylanase
MKKANLYKADLTLVLTLILLVLSVQNSRSQTFCTEPGKERIAGEQDGYRYELWNQNGQGTACMTLGSGALFSGEWEDILNYLARRGLGYDQTQEHHDIGTFYSTYTCTYNPSTSSGNSYLSVYGWTVDPLIEFYIVEDWRNWIPSMDAGATYKGTIDVNGSIYDIIENTRVNQPSIVGTATFQQYFSIRRDVRNSGTINISEHFDKWESLGMVMGKMYEVSFVAEGYQSSGSFEFTELDVFVNDAAATEDEPEEPSLLTVYPNSNPGYLSVKPNVQGSDSNIKIYDALGKIVFTQENISNELLLVSGLTNGMYLVNVYSSRLNYTAKVLIF